MGKKRIITESVSPPAGGAATAILDKPAASSRLKLERGILCIQATYNNTKVTLTNPSGDVIFSSSSGALGFKGAKKGTPFAAGKVADWVAERAQTLGLKEVDVVVKGVGAGREAAIRAFGGKGFIINSIKDATPIPFNGPKPSKPRRV